MPDLMTLVQQAAIWAVPVIFAVTVHEAAHGYAAKYFGDLTAQQQGRLTLNPIPHIDPVGTILVPMILLVLPGGFLFGWAKPVPVNYARLRQPKRDMALVAAAGPLSNLLMAIAWALALRVMLIMLPPEAFQAGVWYGFSQMCLAGVLINVILMVLNLLPLPPLDGSKVVAGIAPNEFVRPYMALERYGFLILILLLMTGILGAILLPIVSTVQSLIFSLLGIA